MKNLLVVVCFVVFPFVVEAQQIDANSLYQNTMSYYNPAYTASEYQLRGGFQYGKQAGGLDRAPVNYFGQYEHNFDSINSGIGITLMRNEIGFSISQSVFINYRYELELSSVNRLSFGVSGGALNAAYDFTEAILIYPIDPLEVSQTKFMLNAGMMLKLNRFRFGVSTLQLNQPNYEDLNFRSQMHTVLSVDYKWLITRKLNLEPSVFFITDSKYMTFTGLLRANYNNKIWIMSGFRSYESIIFGAGAIINKNYSVGYNLDISTSKLNNSPYLYTHGIFINYQIQRPPFHPFKISGTPDF